MTIWAFSTMLNEADVIPYSVPHLYAEGVDSIVVQASTHSTDGTNNALRMAGPVGVVPDPHAFHYQPMLMNELADTYCEPGDWVLAFDADEFWYAKQRADTIAEALAKVPENIRILYVRGWGHVDWDHREETPRALPKVAYRYEVGARVTNGNHNVLLPSGGAAAWDVLELRELQFRSFEHLKRKCHERVDRLDPSLPEHDGVHQKRLAAMSEKELRIEWEQMQARPCVLDPIPCSSPAPH